MRAVRYPRRVRTEPFVDLLHVVGLARSGRPPCQSRIIAYYDKPAEGKISSRSIPQEFSSRAGGLCLEAREPSGRKYLIGCVFTERMAAQDIDRYARLGIRGGSISLDRQLCLG